MRQISLPKWLLWIDEHLKWISFPKLPAFLTLVQALGFFLVFTKPEFEDMLILKPEAVLSGEVWRIFTFIAIPLTNNPILALFVLWFLYYVMMELENIWGATLLTAYFALAWICSVLAAILIGTPIDSFAYMEFSFFFALATLNPNRQLYLFFILPIALKWIAVFIATVLIVIPMFLGEHQRFFYIAFLFANYLIFFGKDYWLRFKRELDKRRKH